jgi:hypothetical protein
VGRVPHVVGRRGEFFEEDCDQRRDVLGSPLRQPHPYPPARRGVADRGQAERAEAGQPRWARHLLAQVARRLVVHHHDHRHAAPPAAVVAPAPGDRRDYRTSPACARERWSTASSPSASSATPEEVVAAIRCLCSDEGALVNGARLPLVGGST